MNIDPFTKTAINRQGIWTDTDCLAREHAVLESVIALVENQGYRRSTDNHRMWVRNQHKIVICLVDDIRSASQDYETDLPYLFDRHTLVITDNYISCPTQYRVLTLPPSFFSIYAHRRRETWQPDRQYCFSVNRIDDRRFRLMLELGKRAHLADGYVNFNCQREYFRMPHAPNPADLMANFEAYHQSLSAEDADKYNSSYQMLRHLMPYRNYEIAHEDIHLKSRCNMIVESYGSDTTAAFSEKIFRALQLPVPWTLYGGHYAVAYLESLGFDCMSDIINHNHYDHLKEIEDKARIFIWFSLRLVREQDQPSLIERCQRARDHNQDLLQSMQERWSADLAQWSQRAVDVIR